MATTGTVEGNLVGVYINSSLIACATNASLSISNDMIDVTCKDSDGARAVLPGVQNIQISVEGLTAYNNHGRSELIDAAIDKTELTLKFGSGVSGDPYVQVDGYISSFEESAGVNDVTTFSATFECHNLSEGTFSA